MKRVAILLSVSILALAVLVSPTAAASPERGGTLVYGSVTEVASLDPHVYQGTAWKAINLCLYNSLLGFNRLGEPSPSLAESWEAPDAKTVIFKLRRGITFHQGQKFTAKDVEFTYKTIVNPDVAIRSRSGFDLISEFKIVDDHNVAIQLAKPFVPFAWAWQKMHVVPAHILSKEADINTATGVTG